MKDRYSPPEPPPYRRPWSLAGLLDRGFSFVAATLVGWLLSILLEWVGMGFGGWEEPGAGHSERLLRTELDWLEADFTAPDTAARVGDWACWGAQTLYHWSGLEGVLRWVVSDRPAVWSGLELLRATLRHLGEYLLAAAYVTQLVGARLAVVVLAIPAFALLGAMGAIDGLVLRDLRRFGGGPESGFLYHHLKKMVRPMFSVPVFLYLISPWSVHPTAMFAPFALLFGYFLQRTLSQFKKYL